MTAKSTPAADHGWFGTETVKTRVGHFDFKNSYPAGDAAKQLREALVFNRAVEAYLAQMHGVSWYRGLERHCGCRSEDAESGGPVGNLMDGATLVLTGNTETVYRLCAIDLKRDGPVVIEAPAMLLGGMSDLWQREIMGIGPTGRDKGKGGRFLLLPPDPDGPVPANVFVNGSGNEIDTIFSDSGQYFADLAWLIEREPHDTIPSHERFQLAAIGIEKGKPFTPDAARKAVFDDAARFASAIARTNSFDSDDPARLVYPDRAWAWAFIGGSASWDSQGYVNTDRRSSFAYIAIGMSPAMVEKHVGTGSQYLWTPRNANGAFLDGGKRYRLHIPPNIPVKNFWSIVVYDADSRSTAASRSRR
jgi:hypothetical protein